MSIPSKAIKLSSLKADTARENDGDWQDVPDIPGLRLKVRSFEYAPYRMARDLLIQKLARKYGRRPIPPEVSYAEYGKLYAEHILLDWEGLDVPYSPETARATLTDPAFRKVVQSVEWAASMLGEVDVEFTEDAVKNSDQPSATT